MVVGDASDHIIGGAGDDTLAGGLDNDIFVFASESGEHYHRLHRARRWGPAGDKIQLADRPGLTFATLILRLSRSMRTRISTSVMELR